MENQIFTFLLYGKEETLKIGQKVQVGYYHEYPDWFKQDQYKRPFYEKIIDAPFDPVKLGVIVGYAGIHPYWLGTNRKEAYLFVKFKEYRFKKAIPVSCIKDAKQEAAKIEELLNNNTHRMGQKGFSPDSFIQLIDQMNKAKEFVRST